MRSIVRHVLVGWTLLLWAGATLAQGVFPPPEFAPDVRFEVSGTVHAVVPLAGGGYAIGGAFDRVNGVERRNLALVDASGALADTGFDPAWLEGTNGAVHALLVEGTALFVGGAFTEAGGVGRGRLARFALADGALDAGFTPTADATVHALASDGALGHVYVGGEFLNIGGTARMRAAKLDADDGSVVAGWVAGYVGAGVVYAFAYDDGGTPGDGSDDRVYVAGTLSMQSGNDDRGLGRLLVANGARDTTWSAGIAPAGGTSVRSLALDAGFVYAGGVFKRVQSASDNRSNLARFGRATGTLDTWNPAADAIVHSMALGADGHLFVGGEFTTVGGAAKQGLAKLRRVADGGDAAGSAIAGFGADANGAVFALAVDGSDDLLAGGAFDQIDAVVERGIARLDSTDGSSDGGFTAGVDEPGEVHAFAVDGTGGIIVGGRFDRVDDGLNRETRLNLARLAADYSLDTTWQADANGEVFTLATVGTDVYVGGNFTQIAAAARTRLARLDAAGAVDATWVATADAAVSALHADAGNDRLYVAGAFTALNATARAGLGRVDLTATGATDATWNPAPDGAVEAVLADAGVVYLGGSFANAGGAARAALARVNDTDGAADADFDIGASGTVHALLLDGANDRLYVGGAFAMLGGVATPSLARIDGPAGLTPAVDATFAPWVPSAAGAVQSLAFEGGLLHAAGAFAEAGGLVRANLARIAADGSIDATWEPGTDGSGVVQIAGLGDGSVLIAGDFSTVTNLARTGLARIGNGGRANTAIQDLAFAPLAPNAAIGQTYTVTFAVANLSGADTPSGSVTVQSVGGETNVCVQGSLAADPNDASRLLGSFECVSDLAGTHTVTVSFTGDAAFLDSQASANYEVAQATTTLVVATNTPTAAGDTVTATITLTPSSMGAVGPTGTVEVEVRDSSDALVDACSIDLDLGEDACDLTDVNFAGLRGTYSVTASYAGDANYVGDVSDAVDHQVLGLATTLLLELAPADPVFGGQVTATVTFTQQDPPGGATGDITVTGCAAPIDLATLVGGQGSCTITPAGAGLLEVDADYPGDAVHEASSDSASVTVAKAEQAALTAIADPTSIVFNATSALSTTGGSGTGAVSFAVTAGGAFCSIDGSTLTGIGVGTCTVTATKAADANFNEATATVEVTVGKAEQATLTAIATPASIVFNATSALSTTGGSGTGAVTFAVTAGGAFCSVAGSTLTGIGVGTCTVTATKAADANFNEATATVEVTVGKAEQATLTAIATPDSIALDDTSALSTTGGSGAGAVTFAVTAGGTFCSVADSTLTGIGVGTCTVTATKAADANFNEATATVEVSVGKAEQATLTAIATPDAIAFNGTSALSTTGGSGTGAVTFAVTAGGTFCSIDGTTLTGIGVGTCTVTATKAADANFNATSATVEVTVSRLATSVTLDADTLTPELDVAVTLTATTTNIPDGTVLAVSNAPGCASITINANTGSCEATFTAEGPVTVTATFTETAERFGSSDSVELTVEGGAGGGDPTTADLGVSLRTTASRYFVADDLELVEFTVVVSNAGPAAVVDAPLVASLDADGFTNIEWTCAPAERCSATAGAGDPISVLLSLGVDESATVRILAEVLATAPSPALAMATIAPPGGIDDLNVDNDSATSGYQRCRPNIVAGSAGDEPELLEHVCIFTGNFEAQPTAP